MSESLKPWPGFCPLPRSSCVERRRFTSVICDLGAVITFLPLTTSFVPIMRRPSAIPLQVCDILYGCCSTLSASLYSIISSTSLYIVCMLLLIVTRYPPLFNYSSATPPPTLPHQLIHFLRIIDAKIFSYILIWKSSLFPHFTPFWLLLKMRMYVVHTYLTVSSLLFAYPVRRVPSPFRLGLTRRDEIWASRIHCNNFSGSES